MYRRCCQERESARHGGIYEYGVGGELAIDPDATWDEVEAGVHLVADDHGHGARVGHVDGLDGERDPLVHARRRRRGGFADAREGRPRLPLRPLKTLSATRTAPPPRP